MTRIFDDPTNFAEEALDGFTSAFRGRVARVDGGVVRATDSPGGQVAVVIGGGSGHYPAFAGLVGIGLAAGAACGNIFASPSAGQVYRVARIAESGGGVLLSFGNYAGDVMHFGVAAKRLAAEGIVTRTVLVTDDIASAPRNAINKRRGIAGDLIVFKVAGAAAESGLSLDEVERLARKANDRTRSLGVAFHGCTLPGAGHPLFSVPEGSMSVGLGIHGEPGISDEDMPTASDLAQLLVLRLLDERPPGAGTRLVPILNGLGTVKYEELFLLYGKVEKLLVEAGLEIVEPECGELVTSLDMGGISLTLLWLDDELEELWSAPADTAAYRKGAVAPRPLRPVRDLDADIYSPRQDASEASVALGAIAADLLEVLRQVLRDNEVELGELDSFAGDGDHGIGMRRGAEAATAAARQAAESRAGIEVVLMAAGNAWAERAGGTSGALWCAGLTGAAMAVGEKQRYQREDAVAAAVGLRDAVTEMGRAEVGDKTMVDALAPFVETLENAVRVGESMTVALSRAAARALQAAEQTALLSPRLGRARPLAERSLGHPDPGATSLALIVNALAEHIASYPTARGNGDE